MLEIQQLFKFPSYSTARKQVEQSQTLWQMEPLVWTCPVCIFTATRPDNFGIRLPYGGKKKKKLYDLNFNLAQSQVVGLPWHSKTICCEVCNTDIEQLHEPEMLKVQLKEKNMLS
jgi:hypothetical protein